MTKLTDQLPSIPFNSYSSAGRMNYDGTSGYFSGTHTSSGNLITAVFQFKCDESGGTDVWQIMSSQNSTGYHRLTIQIFANDYTATANRAGRLASFSQDNTGGTQFRIFSEIGVTDGQLYTGMISLDADTGVHQFILNGSNGEDTSHPDRIVGNTYTMGSGASSTTRVGSNITPGNYFDGDIGFYGFRDAYLTNWYDFMNPDGTPKIIDDSGWTEWGAQPLYWHESGKMDENKGSAGNLTKNGTITVADPDLVTGVINPVQYHPALMEFDGSSGRYSGTYTSSGNKVSIVFQFSRASFTGTGFERIAIFRGPTAYQRMAVIAFSSDYADTRADRIQFAVNNSSNVTICQLVTNAGYLDGNAHTVLFSFDADAGTATLIIDGADAEDTGHAERVAPTTGTLDTGASSSLGWGANNSAADYFSGDIGFGGHADAYVTDWTLFMDRDGNPIKVNETTWSAAR
jgi:hypothetical protein